GSEVGPGEASEGSGDREFSSSQSDLGPDAGQADPPGGSPGKLLSPARRRACIEHVRCSLGVSERRACAALGQHRSTQRKMPQGRDDEERLTADIIELPRLYGRYGYRKIAALLRDMGWLVNDKRVERIWLREGLKVPNKQPKRGRLWLNDGSCIRLRPRHRDHVWSYHSWKTGPRTEGSTGCSTSISSPMNVSRSASTASSRRSISTFW